ncbi:MAG: ECF-type sigma factor [Phycisphaerales bacterium JB065]
MAATGEITKLLNAVSEGRPGAVDSLMDLVYKDLLAHARRQLRHIPANATLQATGLVNEAYLRLFGAVTEHFESRREFYHAATRAMHDAVVDAARRRAAKKRGGDRVRVGFHDNLAAEQTAIDILELDDAVAALAVEHPRQAQVVRLRYFGGLTHEQVAVASNVSIATARRDWQFASAWLRRHLDC